MSADECLLNLLNELQKKDEMGGFAMHLILFFATTMSINAKLYPSYDIQLGIYLRFCSKIPILHH